MISAFIFFTTLSCGVSNSIDSVESHSETHNSSVPSFEFGGRRVLLNSEARTGVFYPEPATVGSADTNDETIDPVHVDLDRNLPDPITTLQEGDRVEVVSPEGNFKFKLGPVLGEGKGVMGKVFLLREQNQVVKFRRGGLLSPGTFQKELDSLEALKQLGIPIAEVLHTDRRLFVVKPYVDGPTVFDKIMETTNQKRIKNIIKKYPNQSGNTDDENLRNDLLATIIATMEFQKLAQLFVTLDDAEILVKDLHRDNLMFSYPDKKWVIVDPGQIIKGGQGSSYKMIESLDTELLEEPVSRLVRDALRKALSEAKLQSQNPSKSPKP